MAAVVVTAIAAVAGTGLVRPGSDSGTTPSTPSTTAPTVAPTSPVPAADSTCSQESGPVGRALAHGAVSARLCTSDGSDLPAPLDALTTDVDQLVDVVDALPAVPANEPGFCIGHSYTDFSVVFTYPDGTTSQVAGTVNRTVGSCFNDVVVVGGRARTGSRTVLQAFATALVRQRATQSPPTTIATPTCPPQDIGSHDTIVPPRGELGLRAAVVCTYRWQQVGRATYAYVLLRSTAVSSDDVARLDDGFRAGAVALAPDDTGGSPGPLQTVVGVSDWGDDVGLVLLGDTLERYASLADGSTQALGWGMPPVERRAVFGG